MLRFECVAVSVAAAQFEFVDVVQLADILPYTLRRL
jgi:hypothetical protein